MTQTFDEDVVFNKGVVVDGGDDIVHLRVEGASSQTQPLQTWQDDQSNVLARITDDGRLQIGDQGMSTPDALIEASKEVLASDLQRGLNMHGQIEVDTSLSESASWSVHELEMTGTQSEAVSGVHAALRARLTYDNNGDASAAELRAGDLEAINQQGSSQHPVGQITGLHAAASNGPGAHLDKAAGVGATLSNDTGGDVAEAAVLEVVPPVNAGTIGALYGLQVPSFSGVEGTVANYASAQLGDDVELHILGAEPSHNPPEGFIKVYPRLNAGVPKLYAKDEAGTEYSLTGGGGHVIQNNGVDMTQRAKLDFEAGANITITATDDPTNNRTQLAIAGAGSVSSVALSMPGEFNVSGSPVTSDGTLTVTKANEGANTVYAGPTAGGNAAPTFRALVAADVPALDASKIATGQLSLARGGTGTDLSSTGGSGQYLKQTSVGGALAVAAIAAADLPTMTGDSGSGGTKGAVPAPAAGDASAGKYLKADGTWAVPPGAGGIPTGVVMAWTTDTAPSGWLLCSGQAVSRSTYAALFSVIGTTYGTGDGSTTFNVPDLRGRFPLGKDNMGGTSANRVTATQADNLGQGAGEENHTLTASEMPSHTHTSNASGGTYESPANKFRNDTYTGNTLTTGATGGGASHNNMPLYLTLNYIIKT